MQANSSGHFRKALFILFSAAMLTLPSLALAESSLVQADKNDPAILASEKKAQASLDEFLKALQNPPEGAENFSVKIGIIDKGSTIQIESGHTLSGVEYFWIVDPKVDGSNVSGQLGNEPEWVKNTKLGDIITFKKTDIVDWLYFVNGKPRGFFSACPLIKNMSPEEAADLIQRFELKCGG